MARMLTGIVLVLTALAAGLVVSGCAGTSTTASTTAADYAGLWVNPKSNNEIWLHATTSGDAVTLRWEREWDTPVVQKATVQSDGTLKAAAVASDLDTNGELAYTGRLDEHSGPRPVDDDARHRRRRGHPRHHPLRARLAGRLRRLRRAHEQEPRAAERRATRSPMALGTIGEGIGAWQDVHGFPKLPPVNAVRPGGAVDKALQATGKTWPRLGDGSLLRPGTGRGQYVYRPLPHGWRLSGRAEDRAGPDDHRHHLVTAPDAPGMRESRAPRPRRTRDDRALHAP